ncbi:hypothetical protein ABBQ32_006381 [Trebouxia sp. C0010 RCD-2024]
MSWLALPAIALVVAITLTASPDNSFIAAQQSELQFSSPSSLLTQVLASQDELASWEALIQAGNASQTLQSGIKSYTVFAPVNIAIQVAIAKSAVTCQSDFFLDQQCESMLQLLNSTSLPQLVQNHIVEGRWWSANFTDGTLLSTVGGGVLQIGQDSDGNVVIGNATIIATNVGAANGVIHVIDKFPLVNAAVNTSMVAALETAGDFGPFDDAKRSIVATNITQVLIPYYQQNRAVVGLPDGGLSNPMPLLFDPTLGHKPIDSNLGQFSYPTLGNVTRPSNDTDIAYMTVLGLAALIKTKQISSVELTRIFQQRLRRYDPILECVITFTDELAQEQAEAADALLANGTYLGPLHGIPYGLKDLMAVPGYLTTWGAASFESQYLSQPAHVYTKLRQAGAVLVAKLATGEMAYDDVWFDGFTKNPWNIAEGSSGSSAGPAAAVAAGLVPFALGTETGGSITYPANTCGVTAHRPSFGLVGRSNIMSLAESLDKVGPFARSAADAVLVLDSIRGRDPADFSSFDSHMEDPFTLNIQDLTVGYLPQTPDTATEAFASLGVTLEPVTMNYTAPADAIYNIILNVEAAAHFDHWQRAHLDDENVRQDLWPQALRNARVIPAVEYIQANRARSVLIQQVQAFFTGNSIDAFIGPPTNELSMGNVVGLPEAVIPVSFTPVSPSSPRQQPTSLGIYAPPNQDSKVLALAIAYQSMTSAHLMRPPIDEVESNILDECLQYSRCGRPEKYNSSQAVDTAYIAESG